MNAIRSALARISIVLISRALRSEAKRRGYAAWIMWYGAYYIHPRHLVFWVCVPHDKDRDALAADSDYWRFAHAQLSRFRYPTSGRQHVHMGTESQETVDREAEGHWWNFMK